MGGVVEACGGGRRAARLRTGIVVYCDLGGGGVVVMLVLEEFGLRGSSYLFILLVLGRAAILALAS